MMRFIFDLHWFFRRGRKSASPVLWPNLLLLACFCLFLLLPLVACGGSASTPSGPVVSTLDDAFSPETLYIKAGQTVTWVNNGKSPHTVTADDNSFASETFQPGEHYSYTFTKPGDYPYYCALHGAPGGIGMAGVIIVDPASTSVESTEKSGEYTRTGAANTSFTGQVSRVPEDYPTITDAVSAAKSGDMISLAPHIYHESVLVKTPGLTIRGRDRNGVILDGNFTLRNGFLVVANNVVLENMTVRHYNVNGFYFSCS